MTRPLTSNPFRPYINQKKAPSGARKHREFSVAYQVSRYLLRVYPDVIFKMNISDGAKLYTGKAKFQNNLSPRGLPDLFIFYPKNGYCGLVMELKREGTRLYKKDGTPASAHIKTQMDLLNRLQALGYCTAICVGLESAIDQINGYLVG